MSSKNHVGSQTVKLLAAAVYIACALLLLTCIKPSEQEQVQQAWIKMVQTLSKVGDVDLDPRKHTVATLKTALGNEPTILNPRDNLVKNEWRMRWSWEFVVVEAAFIGNNSPTDDAKPWSLTVALTSQTWDDQWERWLPRPSNRSLPNSVRLHVARVRIGDDPQMAEYVFDTLDSKPSIIGGIKHRGALPSSDNWEVDWIEENGYFKNITVSEKGYIYLP